MTYRFIEQPCKKFIIVKNWKVIVFGYLFPGILIVSFCYVVQMNKGIPSRFEMHIYEQLNTLNAFSNHIRSSCHSSNTPEQFPNPDMCQLGVAKKNIDFLVLGDSHANSYATMLDVWAKQANLRGYDVTQSSTFYLPDVQMYQLKNGKFIEYPIFEQRNKKISHYLKNHRYNTIVLAGYYSYYLSENVKLKSSFNLSSNENFIWSLKKAIGNATQSSKQVILILDVPQLKTVSADCSLRAEIIHSKNLCHQKLDDIKQENLKFNRILVQVKEDYPNLLVIDPNQVFCNKVNCATTLNNMPLYRNKDDNHLNAIGAKILAEVYLQQYKNPLIFRN